MQSLKKNHPAKSDTSLMLNVSLRPLCAVCTCPLAENQHDVKLMLKKNHP